MSGERRIYVAFEQIAGSKRARALRKEVLTDSTHHFDVILLTRRLDMKRQLKKY
jgi:hypothetical protein